jgi:hypothetical protein
MIVVDLVHLLRSRRFPVGTEAALQEAIGEALREWRICFDREWRLGPRDRIDFFAEGGIGIEAKIRCGKRAIYRQLERYAQHPQIAALVLVTGTALGLPPSIADKPLFFVSLGRAAL